MIHLTHWHGQTAELALPIAHKLEDYEAIHACVFVMRGYYLFDPVKSVYVDALLAFIEKVNAG